ERLTVDPRSDTLVERLWQQTMCMAAGVVTERKDWIVQAADSFRMTIANEVRPQGFITKAVHGEDGGGMFRQILCAAALVLLAEIGAGVGLDLWRYEVRGVGVSTAAMYPIYYFYTTDKWKWDPGLKPETVQMLFRRFGGYLEILYARTRHKDLLPLLADLRPVFSPYVGGLTTLTHGVPEKKRRGLFGW
ncbi:MAG: alginate lyase family protein, partial [Anaerolinea sp.]|nr:alginate lyase family protein [Anaerolinea sp.]